MWWPVNVANVCIRLEKCSYKSRFGHRLDLKLRFNEGQILFILTESSVSLLTGTFPRLLIYRGGQVVLSSVFTLPGQAHARRQYFIGSTCELSPYWIIPGFNCVNTKENTLMIHVVPAGTFPIYIYANQIGLGLQTFGAYWMPSHSP